MVSFNINRSSTPEGVTRGGSMADFHASPGSDTSSSRAPTRRLEKRQSGINGNGSHPLQGDHPGYRANGSGNRPRPGRRFPAWKRCLDVGSVLLTSPVWLPLMLFVAAWIKSTSRGPVFFRQTRVGLGTQLFTILKFRSMKHGADTAAHEDHFRNLVESEIPMTKLDALGDSRLIPGGRFLRMTGLDELPQLFNVLRGDMSLVGPRPCTRQELECYKEWQKARFSAPPGLTGYWQVNGKNKTTFTQMVEMDIQYGQKMSPFLDLIIIMGTLPALALQAIESKWQRPASPERASNRETRETPPRRELPAKRDLSRHPAGAATQLIS